MLERTIFAHYHPGEKEMHDAPAMDKINSATTNRLHYGEWEEVEKLNFNYEKHRAEFETRTKS